MTGRRSGEDLLRRREMTLARTGAYIVIVFLVCQLLKVIPSILEMVDPDIYPTWDEEIIATSHLLLSINSAVNYLLYSITGRCTNKRRSASRRTTQIMLEETFADESNSPSKNLCVG